MWRVGTEKAGAGLGGMQRRGGGWLRLWGCQWEADGRGAWLQGLVLSPKQH